MQIAHRGMPSWDLSNEQVRSLTTPLPARVQVADMQEALRPSTKMLLAMSLLGKPIYEGTVPAATVARRRVKNRAARHARRVHRR